MPLRMKIARSTRDKAAVYRLRHRIFVEEENRFAHHGDHIIDQYDSFDETENILAFDGEQPIAALRVIMENAAGFPAADFYDFGPFRCQLEGRCACVGWLCIDSAHRRHPGLLIGLIKMAFREMRKHGARHVLATLHPPVMPMLERIVGARAVAAAFHSEVLNVEMLPIHVDLDKLPPGGRETFADPSTQILEDSNERRIYRRNEIILRRGETGTEAFLIMRGSVRMRSETPLAEDGGIEPLFGPGQIFGELSLLDGGPRTATVVAHSNEVDLMVWTREELLQQLRDDQEKALQILTLLGQRMRHQIEGHPLDPPLALAARILVDTSRQGAYSVDMQWLSRQCGIGGDTFNRLLTNWEDRQWIAADRRKGRLVVKDHLSLVRQIGMP